MTEHAGKEKKGSGRRSEMSLEQLLADLDAAPDGLRDEEARARLERVGPNELAEKKVSVIRLLLSYFWGPIPWMIEIAAVLSAVVRHWPDFVIIMVLLVMNAAVAFWEEYQANNTIAALKEKLAMQARVLRDGKWKRIPSRRLVPGDVVRLRIGEVVPADAKLIGEDPVQVDQSTLTGESLPVERQQGQNVFSGSVLKQGETEALVFATGSDTYFGRTAELVESTKTRSHFQKAVLKIGNVLIVAAAVLAAVIIAVALLRSDPMLTTLRFVLVLTVAAVPVAMPTVLSVTMAVGARLLARKQAIVTRLSAIEEMAGVDVLCSDKTGTLTKNTLTLGDPYTVDGRSADEVIEAAALASRAEDEDAIDAAVLGGVRDADRLARFHISRFSPFDPVRKRTEAVVRGPDGQEFQVAKGAPQVVLAMSDNRDAVGSDVRATVDRFAARGYRSLGVARSDGSDAWQFMGVLPLYDPPREDSKETIARAAEMGIRTKMVTGDQTAIARETSRRLGLGDDIVDASFFDGSEDEDPDRIDAAIEGADGFSQVFPEHKHRIVETLQSEGHLVGMTGDGVNDAPALKKADAGIAVSGATDAARSAADLVLLAPGLKVILDAVRESRKSFQRMNNYSVYRIAETIRVLLFMTISILVFNFYPVTAVMIVLLALLNDSAILSIAYDRVPVADRPQRWDMKRVLIMAGALGLIGMVASFTLFFVGEQVFHLPRGMLQSMMYLKLSLAGHLTIFVTRTKGPFWSSRPAGILLGAVGLAQVINLVIVVYGIFMPAIGWAWAGGIWAYALVWFFIADRLKIAVDHVLDRQRHERFSHQPSHEAA